MSTSRGKTIVDPSVPWPRKFKVRRITTRGAMVYIIACPSTQRYKIGHAKNPERRLRHLQIGSPTDLKLMAQTFLSDSGIDPLEFEKTLHVWLKPYRCQGEWFETTRQRVILAWHQVAGILAERDRVSQQEATVPQQVVVID